MAVSSNAKVQAEGGQVLVAYAVMTTTDRKVFTTTAKTWSGKSGKEPIVRPNGVKTGRLMVTPAVSGTNNLVDIAAFTADSIAVEYFVNAVTDQAITRGATANIAKISSITMTSAGAIAVIAGIDSADSTVNEVRGSPGAPPFIPVDSVEIAQIRFSGTGAGTAAPITEAQIFQQDGEHTERVDYPGIKEINNVGIGSKSTQTNKVYSFVEMDTVLPQSHTGSVSKRVYIQHYTPTMIDITNAIDFKPVENSHSVSSQQVYGNRSIASTSSSIGQGGVTIILGDGITDSIVSLKDEVLTFKFFQDRNKLPHIIMQGKLGLARTFPVAGQVQAAATVSAETISAEFNS